MIPPRKTWLIHMGQFITAWGGPMLFASPVVLSATWFPGEQQTLAISVGVTAGAVGQAVSFIIGPVFVPDSGSCQQNRSGHNISDIVTEHIQTISLENKNHNCSGDAAFIKDAGDGITKLLLVEFIWSVLLLLVTMLYFPARPPTPPSISASFEREDYLRGFLRALKSPKVYLIGFIYALPAAVFSMWANFIDVFLLPIGIQQDDAGWIGFWGIFSAGISCIIVGGFIDHFKAWLKSSILVLYCISIGSAVWFLLLCMKIIPFSLGMVYASFILTSAMMNSPQALMFELICQVCYPIGEATASGILCIIFNFVAIIFLILASIEILGTAWLNWSLLVSVGVCVPPLALVSVNFKRLEVDKHGDKSE
ncbi:unnamed protein product [Owenia fusiformis]|uniref:Uncharacterized protein n=1 Tax=Owenia fusiformis TaxID=6347 RepID=A0A8J1Y7Y4_OWEFU|nr:unnamed protein product [Owenia fusiformis]